MNAAAEPATVGAAKLVPVVVGVARARSCRRSSLCCSNSRASRGSRLPRADLERSRALDGSRRSEHSVRGIRRSARPGKGFVVEQIVSALPRTPAYFWGTHAGGEIDLVLGDAPRRIGVEIEVSEAPTMTKSLHVALGELGLERVLVCTPESERFPIHERVEAGPLEGAIEELRRVFW